MRLLERKGNDLLKGHKYTFLKHRVSGKVFELQEHPTKLGEGYRLVQLFKEFWEIGNPEEAEGYLVF